MQNFTYHTHNSELNFDGQSTAEEMIAAAEEKGFAEIGVSNHLICHKNLQIVGWQPMFFQDFKTAEDCYKKHINIIRETALRHKIKVRVGFETDFFSSAYWRNNFEKMIKNLKVDYLIGSTHFIRSADETFLCNLYHIKYFPELPQDENFNEYLRQYWQNIVGAIESGYFDFIAHIDYCAIFNLCLAPEWDEYKWRVIEALAQCKQAYEINTSGFNRIGVQHPAGWMIEELNKRNVPVLISDDAHKTEALGQHFGRAEKMLDAMGYANRFKFR